MLEYLPGSQFRPIFDAIMPPNPCSQALVMPIHMLCRSILALTFLSDCLLCLSVVVVCKNTPQHSSKESMVACSQQRHNMAQVSLVLTHRWVLPLRCACEHFFSSSFFWPCKAFRTSCEYAGGRGVTFDGKPAPQPYIRQ